MAPSCDRSLTFCRTAELSLERFPEAVQATVRLEALGLLSDPTGRKRNANLLAAQSSPQGSRRREQYLAYWDEFALIWTVHTFTGHDLVRRDIEIDDVFPLALVGSEH